MSEAYRRPGRGKLGERKIWKETENKRVRCVTGAAGERREQRDLERQLPASRRHLKALASKLASLIRFSLSGCGRPGSGHRKRTEDAKGVTDKQSCQLICTPQVFHFGLNYK